AHVNGGIIQAAVAGGGNASATLNNSGSITVSANAHDVAGTAADIITFTPTGTGTGFAFVSAGASAAVNGGIVQIAAAIPAVTGTSGGTPTAAIAGNAAVTLTNSGTVNINANATATAT